MNTCILAIESSCDDTSAAIIVDGKLQSNIVFSQIDHSDYGGVVPELASRAHMQKIVGVVDKALNEASCSVQDLNAIACTRGPGLMGSLIVGLSYAKGMALSLDIPLIEVNHMRAHVLAHFIEEPFPSFPFLCLTVSGGHTQILKVRSYLDMEILGETQDDAAGEAFDKIGKLMQLPYPAGPAIDQLAKEGNAIYDFPEAEMSGLNFSFSGLKTAVRYFLRDQIKKDPHFVKDNIHNICASVQKTIISTLLNKVRTASVQENIQEVAIAGGVSANSALRESLNACAKQYDWNVYIPKLEYCTDNAGMIAQTAYYLFNEKRFSGLDISPQARLTMTDPTS